MEMFSLWYSIVASQLLYIRLHECCKQLKRPVAVIPQCSYPETLSLETAGMSSFSLSLSLFFFCFKLSLLLVSLPFCMSFSLSFCPFLACASRAPQHSLPFLPFPFSHAHSCGVGESRPGRYAHRHDNLSLTQRPVQTMGAMHVAK